MPELTIDDLVDMSYGTARDNGWHDRSGPITGETPEARLAALVPTLQAFRNLVEAIRKPDKFSVKDALRSLEINVGNLCSNGIDVKAVEQAASLLELGKELQGSATQVQSWLVLMVSELAEASEAVERRDKATFAEELAADVLIRAGNAIGAINDHAGHFLGPINPEAVILAKNEHNQQRGYRHGGKLA